MLVFVMEVVEPVPWLLSFVSERLNRFRHCPSLCPDPGNGWLGSVTEIATGRWEGNSEAPNTSCADVNANVLLRMLSGSSDSSFEATGSGSVNQRGLLLKTYPTSIPAK